MKEGFSSTTPDIENLHDEAFTSGIDYLEKARKRTIGRITVTSLQAEPSQKLFFGGENIRFFNDGVVAGFRIDEIGYQDFKAGETQSYEAYVLAIIQGNLLVKIPFQTKDESVRKIAQSGER